MDSKIFRITIEGQTMELPAEIAGDDTKLKQALSPYFPGAANAKIVRAEADGVVTVNVIKQAGTKGVVTQASPELLRENLPAANSPAAREALVSDAGNTLRALTRMPESQNPVMVLYAELGQVDRAKMGTYDLLKLNQRVKDAIGTGEKQAEMMKNTLVRMCSARAEAKNTVPEGL